MRNLLIIAAGNGTRMGNISVPKALYDINGKPNIEWLIESSKAYFNKIYVVCRTSTKTAFNYLVSQSDKVTIVPIDSGLGDGHAVMNALYSIHKLDSKFLDQESVSTIVWGDLYCPAPDIFAELSAYDDDLINGNIEVVVPLAMEDSPYVHFTIDEKSKILAANFSKYGEVVERGLHDQSIFMGSTNAFFHYISLLHIATWKNGKYVTNTGELNLLHIFHLMDNLDKPAHAHVTEIILNSYNTIKEAEKI